MTFPLRVTLLANAGVFLRYGDTALVLDGVYGGEGHPFSAPSRRTMELLRSGEPPFEKLDYLLFTHDHPDHFSPALTMDLLRVRPVKGVFAPDTAPVRESGLFRFLRERQIPCMPLSEQIRDAAMDIAPGVTVRAVRALHLDRRYHDVLHFCYLLSFGEKRVLFTADVDYTVERLDFAREEKLQAVFLNPLFFSDYQRGRFFRHPLWAERVCVYHVPFLQDDAENLRPLLARSLQNWPPTLPPPLVFQDALQTETFP